MRPPDLQRRLKMVLPADSVKRMSSPPPTGNIGPYIGFFPRLVSREKLLDALVVVPARQQHLISGKRSKRTTRRTAPVFDRLVVECEGLISQHVFEIEPWIECLGTIDPKRKQPIDRRQLRALDGPDAIFEITRSGEGNRAEKIRILYPAFQLGDPQTR